MAVPHYWLDVGWTSLLQQSRGVSNPELAPRQLSKTPGKRALPKTMAPRVAEEAQGRLSRRVSRLSLSGNRRKSQTQPSEEEELASKQKTDDVIRSEKGNKGLLWRIALKRILQEEKDRLAQFIRERRDGTIESIDSPSKYTVIIRAKDNTNFPLFSRLVSVLTRTSWQLEHATLGPHTLSWTEPICTPRGEKLPPGSLNMYLYPMVSFYDGPVADGKMLSPMEVTGELLSALDWVVKRSATEPQRTFWRRDSSGGFPIHALLIANNTAALDLVKAIFTSTPLLLMQKH